MKKVIILGIVFCMLVFGITGCTNKIHEMTTKVENAFSDLYEIERLEVVLEDGPHQTSHSVRKMKANDMYFYIATYNVGNGLMGDDYIHTTILSSVYIKYKTEIENIGEKYELDAYFETRELSHFGDCEIDYIRVNAVANQKDAVDNFVKDVLDIDEIKELYNRWSEQGPYEKYVDDYSQIIIEEDTLPRMSIFRYYEDMLK